MSNKKGLEDRVADLEERLITQDKKIEDARKTIRSVKVILSAIDKKKANAQIEYFQERLTYITDRLHIEILKYCVVSQVTRAYPELWMPLVLALESEPDEFWAQKSANGEELTINEWRKRLMTLEGSEPGRAA